jgi:drug/metabolite transporter (DMT)-like permease
METIRARCSGALCVVGALVLWSSLGLVVRHANIPVHLLIFYSNLLSVFLLAPVAFKRGIPRGKPLAKLLMIGPVTLANTFTFFYALQNTTISNALMTHYTAPVMVAVMAALVLGERLTPRVAVSVLIAMVGLWLLLGVRPAEIVLLWERPDANAMGIGSGLASGIAYACLVILVRALSPGNDPVVLTFLQNVMMVVLLTPFVREFPAHAAWSFVLVGVVHSSIAPALYFRGMALVQANRAAVLGYVEPVCAIAIGAMFLGEVPGPLALAGGALILYSGYHVISGRD